MKRKLLIRMGMFLAGMHALAAGAQQPAISGVSPMLGYPASSVVISGSNFNTSPGSNIVFFGATRASVSAASATSLTVSVPAGATYKPVTVNNTASALVGYSQYPFLPTYDNSAYLSGILNFAGKVDFAAISNCHNVAIGDIDGDGKPDVVLINAGVATLSVYRNTGSVGTISYAAGVNFTTNGSPTRVAIGDIDGDGKPDISVSHFGSSVSVFRNMSSSGTISLAAKVDFATGTQSSGIAIGDIDNDGKTDIAVSNWGSANVSVLRNTSSPGAITFATKVDFAAGTQPNSVAIGDLDGDGKQDLVFANLISATATILRNTSSSGSLSFVAGASVTTGDSPSFVAIGDMDGDGKADLAIANSSSNTVSTFRNTGSSGTISFAAKVDFATGVNPGNVAMGDINGDGRLDLAVTNGTANTISVFRNTGSLGTISFAAKADFATGIFPTCVAIGDVDGDGKPDMAVSNHDGPSVSVIRNNPLSGPLVPRITAVSSVLGIPGSSFTLTGANFNTTTTNNKVYFGATKATVSAASATSLTVAIPTGATYKEVSVNNAATSLVGFSKYSFLPTYDNSGYAPGVVNFAMQVPFSTGGDPSSVAIGDIDGDGKPDMVVVNRAYYTVSVYHNTSSSGSITAGSFAAQVTFGTGTFPRSVAIGDIDGDGKPDLVVANTGSNTVSVLRNTSTVGSITSGSFAAQVTFAAGSSPYSVAIGDIDGDGKADLAVANASTNTVSVLHNTSSSGTITTGSFATQVAFECASNPYSVAIGDLDGDGKADLAVANFSSNYVSVHRNTCNSGAIDAGSFATPAFYNTGNNPYSIAIGDVDNDGKPDLAVANSGSNTVSVHRNTSGGIGLITSFSFATYFTFATGSYPVSVAIGDIDGDGKPDIAVANNTSNDVSVLRNTNSGSLNSGSFATPVTFATGAGALGLAIGDMDSDGKPDLAVTNYGAGSVSLIKNSPLLPTIPTITTVSPLMGYPASTVTITGTNFNTTTTNNMVYFGATRAAVSAASTTSLTVSVPSGATFQCVTVSNTDGGLTAYSQYPFLPSYNNSGYVSGTVNLNAKVDFSTGNTPFGVASGDLDGDGKADMATANINSNNMSVFLNNGSTGTVSFASRVDFATPSNPRRVVMGDIDGDGKLDIAIVVANMVCVFRNTSTIGAISFAGRVDIVASAPQSVSIGDIDGDGKADLATANQGANSASVFRNTGSSGTISFAAGVSFTVGSQPRDIAIADLDGDGKKDLSTSNIAGHNISILRNTSSTGSVSFATKVDLATGTNTFDILAGDVDGDGKQDVVVSNQGSSTISVLRNLSSVGTLSFATHVEFATGTQPQGIGMGDFDGDGKPDVAVANAGPANASVIRNMSTPGTISFAPRVNYTTGSFPYGMVVGDMDGDGKADVMVSNLSANSVSVLRNNPLVPIAGTLAVCIGGTTSLTNATTGGTWMSGNAAVAAVGSSTGVVTGVIAGTAVISYIVSGGSATVIVTVNATPTISVGSGVAICTGSSTSLTATGATSYSWSPATGLSATTGAGVSANPMVTTTYTVIGSTGGCSNTATVTVSVNPSPAPIISSAPLMITTVAGNGSGSFSGDGGQATAAGFTITWNVRLDAVGNMYIIDGNAGRIRKVNTAGVITTVAGNGTFTHSGDGGPATSAGFAGLYAMAIDAAGNIYTADASHRVRKISTSGIVTTIAGNGTPGATGNGGDATAALLSYPQGIAVDLAGNIFISENGTSRIRKINTSGIISTYAGGSGSSTASGVAATATYFSNAGRMTCDAAGNLYIADRGHGRVCKITTTNMVYTVAGISGSYGYSGDGGPATAAQLNGPNDLCIGSDGSIYIAEDINNYIRKVSPDGIISTIAGNGTATHSGDNGPATSAGMWTMGIDIDASGALYIATYNNFRIRKIYSGPVCTGSSITLSNAISGGSWSSSNTNVTAGSTGIVTGNTAGTSVVTYMMPTGCYKTMTITVNATPAISTSANAYICSGSSTSLTASGGTTYSWSPATGLSATTGASVSANPTVTTTYTVTATTANCSNVASVTVFVNAIPTVSAGPAVSICTGSSTTLTATGATTYRWSPPTGLSATTGASVSANPAVTTTYTVRGTSAEGCSSTATVTASVNPLSDAGTISGISSLCTDGSTTLTNSVSGGVWSSGNSSVATIGSTGIVTGIAAGTTTISYTVTGGCDTDYAMLVITVNEAPGAIAGTAAICVGETSNLSSSPSGGTWSSSGTIASVDETTGVVTGISAGFNTITYTLGGGCYSTFDVTVNSLPAAITGVTSVCTGSTTALSTATTGGTWSSSNTSRATIDATSGIVTGMGAGTASITYTSDAGCRRKITVTIMATPASITGSLSMCSGNTGLLSSATTGGSWHSSDDAVATVDAGTGVVSGIVTGTATIVYAIGSCSVSAIVTVSGALASNSGTSVVCIGQATTLSNATAGGTWSSSDAAIATAHASTGLVTGVSAGTANITYTASAGCFAVTVATVNGAPADITGTMTVCPGLTTALSNATSGGTWSSSNTTRATIDASTGVLTGVSGGTVTISYIVSAGCSQTTVVMVLSSPAVISGTGVVCEGATTTLTCSPGGGTWSSSDAAATVGSTGIVTGVSAGTATIFYTSGAGCASEKVVTVTAAPTAITGTLGVCVGGTATLSSTPTGGTWVVANVSKATVGSTTGAITGVAVGTTAITYTAGGCRIISSVTVSATPAVIVGALTVCIGSTTSLTSATTGGTWSSSDGAVATVAAGTGVVNGINTGTAIISYSNGTCERTAIVTVNAALGANTGSGTVCIGQSTDLNNATTGGTWSSSNTTRATVNTSTGLVVGVSAGTANISYRLGAGCFGITEMTVNTTLSNITGAASVCPGATTSLSHSDGGGVWTSGIPARATVDAGTGVVAGVSAGTVYITYAVSGCYKTIIVTVNLAPAAISGTAILCEGATTALSSSPAGGTWSSSATSTATVSGTGVVTGLVAGNATISYSRLGCAATREVTVTAAPGTVGGTLSACIGNTTTLTAAPGGGTWSSSNTARATIGASTGVVTGIGAGTATITYSISATCMVTAMVTINPVPSAISGTLSVCATCTTTLGSTPGGGIWTSSNTAAATIGSGSGLLSGVGVGNTTISYVAGGCLRTAVVTVNAALPSTYGTPVVCVGQTNATLGNPVSGGTWSSGNTAIAGIHAATGLLTGTGVGNANITYTTSPGVYTIIVATVSAMMSPNVGATTICPDATTTLTNATTGGAWSSSNTLKATVVSGTGVVTGITGGTASVSYMVNVGCYKVSTITINSAPNTTGATTVVNGASTTFAGSPAGGTWSSANPAIASVSVAGVVTGNSVAATNITYTLGTGCFSIRPINVLTARPDSPMGSGAAQASVLTVYPNPTSGTLTIDAPVAGMFTVYTIDGKQLTQYNVTASANMVSLPQQIAAGIYMCRYMGTDGSTAIVRLVFEH